MHILTSIQAEDRWQRMEARLSNFRTNFTKFTGIDARHHIPDLAQGRTNWTEALKVSPGLDIEALQTFHLAPSPLCANTTSAHYACTISHLFMLLEAYHSGEELLLVLEDDMEILRMPTDGLIAVAPPDWQILQLYSLGGLASHLYTASPVHLWEPWTLQKHLFNTGAYLINREGMQQVLDTYMPGATWSGEVTVIDFTSLTDLSHAGCNADQVIYTPARTYFCTDLFFIEEGSSSLLATDANYLPFHVKTRDLVKQLFDARGFRQVF